MDRMEKDEITVNYTKKLAGDVFVHTAKYDAEIARFFTESKDESLNDYIFSNYEKVEDLRYGENPDQKAAIYKPIGAENWQPFQQLHGKKISYNNYIDCIAAYNIVKDMHSDEPLVANIKHTNPCGVGIGATAKEAYVRAVAVDPTSYFGGIVCSNRNVDKDFALELKKSFLECIIAPAYADDALEVLQKKKNLRLLIPAEKILETKLNMRDYGNGLLVQQTQNTEFNLSDCKTVTDTRPDEKLSKALTLGWNIVRNVKSNAIVLADDTGAIGVGAGQMSRVDAMKIAIRKAKEAGLNIENTIIASDAFFPFRDSIDVAAEYKIAGAIQPGGSIRDQEVIDACNEHKMFMLFTGQRVFKH
jgi:phosphoribosylaminoimidazolecarboxamide formyltransferase/IMP cyclohydrolase